MANNNMSGKDLFIGAVIGGVIGATAALLLAPKSGRETRRELSKGFESAKAAMKDHAEQFAQYTGDIKVAATDRWTDIRDSAVGTVKEVATSMEKGMEQAGDGFTEIAKESGEKL
ncbi:hypothetical protein GXN76_12645 [Kroppenstedtia pulmonis]|uniref:YtxH domain-containing protein n=1 Tax=Kroppenstedtia pulmonis TaxID=1380685 RepID=A0A7D4CPC7_9BACL|nr:YtxH domain-containing protein [Kroppenstedtia pulmonis]QKG85238.1 hypothetical protein GXN76_12645 [Kroppenstedtia pulmonis]